MREQKINQGLIGGGVVRHDRDAGAEIDPINVCVTPLWIAIRKRHAPAPTAR